MVWPARYPAIYLSLVLRITFAEASLQISFFKQDDEEVHCARRNAGEQKDCRRPAGQAKADECQQATEVHGIAYPTIRASGDEVSWWIERSRCTLAAESEQGAADEGDGSAEYDADDAQRLDPHGKAQRKCGVEPLNLLRQIKEEANKRGHVDEGPNHR